MRNWRRTSSVRRTAPCWSPRKRCWNRTRRCSRPATCPAGASWTPRSTCCSARSASTPRWHCRASRPTRCSAATRSSTTRAPSHTTASLAGRQERALAAAAAGGRRTGGGAGIHPGALPRGPRRSAATGWRGCRPAAPARGRLPGAEPLAAGDARTQGPDEHGGRPGSARAVLRPPPGGVRMEPALGAEERRRGKQEPVAPGPARAPAAGDPGAAQERFPGQPRPTLPGAAARGGSAACSTTAARRCSNWWTPGGSARLSNRARRCPARVPRRGPTAGLAYLLNLDRWLTRHGVDISL